MSWKTIALVSLALRIGIAIIIGIALLLPTHMM